MLTLKEAFQIWRREIKPAVVREYGSYYFPALAESWNNYTDELCKDDQLTALQYRYCPAWDDDMPENDQEYILEQMGVEMAWVWVRERPDDTTSAFPDGSSHYRVLIKRNSRELEVYYSLGSAFTGQAPELADVFHSLLTDTADIEGLSFEDWCDNFGFDSDSRRAERAFKACQRELQDLRRLFTDSELTELRELYADY